MFIKKPAESNLGWGLVVPGANYVVRGLELSVSPSDLLRSGEKLEMEFNHQEPIDLIDHSCFSNEASRKFPKDRVMWG